MMAYKFYWRDETEKEHFCLDTSREKEESRKNKRELYPELGDGIL